MMPLRWLPLVLLLSAPAFAQDLAEVSPAIAKVEYEDAAIRVIRSHYEPGAHSAMHSHPPRIVITLTPGTLRLTRPDGSSVVPPADPQQRPLALGPETHAVANIGNTPVENIEIEFKHRTQLGDRRATPAESRADPDSLLSEPHHHWVMETPAFRIVEARIPPGETTQWHRHRYGNVSVRTHGSRISSQEQGGEWTPPTAMATGAVVFDGRKTPLVHRVKNSGTEEYRVVLVEFLAGE